MNANALTWPVGIRGISSIKRPHTVSTYIKYLRRFWSLNVFSPTCSLQSKIDCTCRLVNALRNYSYEFPASRRQKRRLCRSCACLVRTFLRHFNLILCHCVNTTDCRCGCREIERAQVLFGCLHHLFRLWLLRFRVSYTCSGTFTLFSTSACLSLGEFGRWHRSAMRCTRDNTSALSLSVSVSSTNPICPPGIPGFLFNYRLLTVQSDWRLLLPPTIEIDCSFRCMRNV